MVRNSKKALIFIVLSALFAGIGQLMWKRASLSLEPNFISLLNGFLIGGIFLYLLATIFMVLSFRGGELSMLHPFLATSFVWVTLTAPFFFADEIMTTNKVLGIFLIFFGVSLIGIGGARSNGNRD